jgi:hypothetical protein
VFENTLMLPDRSPAERELENLESLRTVASLVAAVLLNIGLSRGA